MSNTIVISAHENLIDTVASLLDITCRDLSNQIVVFPGKRPAHFLRKKLSEILGGSFIPPKIFSMDGFISYLTLKKMNVKSRVLDPLDAAVVLFDIHKELKERIGGVQFLALDNFLPLGLKLFSELEELMLAGIETKKIKSLVESIPYGKLNLLGAYYEKFYNSLHSCGYTTRALQYTAAAQQIDAIDLTTFSQILFAGFFALTPAEKKIFSGIRICPNVRFVYQRVAGFESILPDSTEDNRKDSDFAKDQQAEMHFIKSSDTHGQVFALSSLLKKAQMCDQMNERSVIVLPNEETLFPLLNEALAEMPDDSYNIALGYPLARTPIFRFISTLTELAVTMEDGNIPSSMYIKFVLHPYTKNIQYNEKSEVTRVLVHTIEKFLAEDQSRLQVTLDELENWTEMFDAAVKSASGDDVTIRREDLQNHLTSIHNKTIRLVCEMESVGAFASRCIEVLTYIYENSTANLHPLFRRYAERMIEVFESIDSSLISNAQFEERVSYVSLLKQYVAAQDVPFSGTPLKGMQVLGLLETRNLQFDTVYILDVNEGILPPGRGDDMLLPQSLRQMLGMETYHSREKLVEYYFDLLIHSAKHVYIFFKETSSGEKERSRFVQKLLWKKEKEIGDLLPDDAIASVCYRMRLTNETPTPIPKTPEIIQHLNQMEYSATKLDSYLKCPLKFYYRYVLRLSEKETVTEELDQVDAGKIVHVVLRELFAPLIGRVILPADIHEMPVEEIVTREFRRQFGNELTGNQHLMYIQVMRQIKRFLSNYQMPLVKSEEITITGLETDIQAIDNNTILSARPDRIERRGNKIHIIDYKISSRDANYKINWKKLELKERASWNETIGSLQLPFYLLVYMLCQNENESIIIPEYLLLGKNIISKDIESPLFENEAEMGDKYSPLKEIIRTLIGEIKDSTMEFMPSQNLSSVCKYCSYTNLCGTTWIK